MIELKNGNCTGCGWCTKVCPHGVLTMNGKKAQLTHEDRCIECGACQLNCHDDAIFVTKGTGCLYAIAMEGILKLSPKCG